METGRGLGPASSPRSFGRILSWLAPLLPFNLGRMKHVFSSPDSAQVALARSVLDAQGILCDVRNDAVSQSMPGMPFVTELWVVRDEDYEDARRLLNESTD